MSCEGGGGKASDDGQYLIGRFGPMKRLRLLVVGYDELLDGSFQFPDAGMRAALDLSLGEQCKPAFDLVKP